MARLLHCHKWIPLHHSPLSPLHKSHPSRGGSIRRERSRRKNASQHKQATGPHMRSAWLCSLEGMQAAAAQSS